jgi:succinate dehydrogenase / fumarate reductase cytochrome b subunit
MISGWSLVAMPVRHVFSSSVGTKVLVALTGLALFLYLVLHLAGNLLVFAGPATFNEYSHKLISNPLVVPVEIGLLAIFLVHVYKTVKMWIQNQRARPVGYEMNRWAGHTSRKSVGSATMIWTGLITFFFVLLHLKQFKYGTYYQATGSELRDLYRLEIELFQQPGTVAIYVVCMALIGFHLRHGVSSALQSLGVDHPRLTPRLLVAGVVTAIVIAGGFAAIPLWVYFTR